MPRPWRRRCSPLRWGGLSISRRRSLDAPGPAPGWARRSGRRAHDGEDAWRFAGVANQEVCADHSTDGETESSKRRHSSEHKRKTKAQYDRVLLWLDAWSRLSGLGVTVTLSKRSGSLWKEKSDCVAWLGPSCLPGGATHGSRRERGVCPLVQTNEPSYGVVGSNSLCKPTGSSYAHCLHCCCQQCERRLG